MYVHEKFNTVVSYLSSVKIADYVFETSIHSCIQDVSLNYHYLERSRKTTHGRNSHIWMIYILHLGKIIYEVGNAMKIANKSFQSIFQ